MTYLLLALVGSLEAVVYQARYRATHGTPLAVGCWTLAVCVLRVVFVHAGVSAAIAGDLAGAIAAYAVPAAIVTGIVRWVETRPKPAPKTDDGFGEYGRP